MRNAFVVIVAICIGLATGFIIPSSTTEISVSSSTANISDSSPAPSRRRHSRKDTKTRDSNPSAVTLLFPILPRNRKDIDDKDLYEHATEKQNNQSERAFIYIKQKYKKPVRNRVFMVAPDRPDIGLERANIINSPLTGTDAPPCLPYVETKLVTPTFREPGNTFFHEYDFNDKDDTLSPLFSDPDSDSSFRCNLNDDKRKVNINDIDKRKPIYQTLNRDTDQRRDYFELLKQPILRPINRGNNKRKYEKPHPKTEFAAHSPPELPYNDYYLKKYHLRSQYVPKTKLAEERPSEPLKNYGFNRPYISHHTAFRNKEIMPRADDISLDGDFVNDVPPRLFDNTPDEDKLLDKYLKDTLEEQGGPMEKPNSNNDCSYRDCVLQSSSRQYMGNGLLYRPECKCGRRLNLNPPAPYYPSVNDRPLREQTKRNETTLTSMAKSAEMNYYEEILTDDSLNTKMEDDIMRPPHRLNDTSPR